MEWVWWIEKIPFIIFATGIFTSWLLVLYSLKKLLEFVLTPGEYHTIVDIIFYGGLLVGALFVTALV